MYSTFTWQKYNVLIFWGYPNDKLIGFFNNENGLLTDIVQQYSYTRTIILDVGIVWFSPLFILYTEKQLEVFITKECVNFHMFVPQITGIRF